jgi:hypothetical protein
MAMLASFEILPLADQDRRFFEIREVVRPRNRYLALGIWDRLTK